MGSAWGRAWRNPAVKMSEDERGGAQGHGERHPGAGHGRGGEGQVRAIPACPWAWRTWRPCCSPSFLKFDAAAPDWPDRDRFVLSAGHGSMLLYALLHLTGYPGMTMEELSQLPPARLQDGGPSRVRPRAGHRDHDRSAGPGPRQCRRHGAGRAAPQCARSATPSSITSPM